MRIPGLGEAGGLPSLGSHRVGRDRSDLAASARVWKKGGNEILCFNLHKVSVLQDKCVLEI